MKRSHGDTEYYALRLRVASYGIYCILVLMAVRVWYLQGMQGAHFRDLSENNRIRTIRIAAPRGNIYDRNDRVIVRNRPAFNIGLMLEDIGNLDETLQTLAEVSGYEKQALKDRLSQDRSRRPFEPQIVLSDVSREMLAKIKVNGYRLPGVIVESLPTRSYPFPGLAAQVLGYTREITREQLDQMKGAGYRQGDIVGHSGIEKVLEQELRGDPGYVRVEVDAHGNRRQELGIIDELAGRDVYLTLDLELQQAAQEALGDHSGAVVALDVTNGDILAMASAPSFDNNLFSRPMTAELWKSLAMSKEKPLSNRGMSSIYPPGSTMKLFFALAGLSEGVITPETTVSCPGYYWFAGRRYHCHKRGGHGTVNLKTAIVKSCNVYFYQLGQSLGVDKIAEYGALFGFGTRTGIDIPGEEAGVLPTREWKVKRFGEQWYPGETLSVSIGQGYWSVTPLQLAVAMVGLANDGKIYQPRLVRKIADPLSGGVKDIEPVKLRDIGVKASYLKLIREYAGAVVNDEGGTGSRAKLPGVLVGGKTGTAQVSRFKKGSKDGLVQDHGWFVAFAPVEKPKVALVVIAENVGGGGLNAAPIAKAVLERYFLQTGDLVRNEEGEVISVHDLVATPDVPKVEP